MDAMTTASGPGSGRAPDRRRRVALVALALPVLILSGFAVGEAVGAEEGWWGHVVQLGLVVVLAVLAWRLPRVGGPALLAAGLALGVWALVTVDLGVAMASVLVLLVAPLLVAGWALTGPTARHRGDRSA